MRFDIALCQMMVEASKEKNVEKAVEYIKESSRRGALMCILPEMFNCPYDISLFNNYAEDDSGDTIAAIRAAAKEHGLIVVAGSIPEIDGDKIYNTSYVISERGEILGKHRKVHLFDIHIPGEVIFKESAVLSSGDDITVIDTSYCKIAIAICYDLRFPEMFQKGREEGAYLTVLPGAFHNFTGPKHWELLLRARAVDSQMYIAGVSSAMNNNSEYKSYGHSMMISPDGDIVTKTDFDEDLIIGEINLDTVDYVRRNIPLTR